MNLDTAPEQGREHGRVSHEQLGRAPSGIREEAEMTEADANIVLIHIQGMRRELAAVLENQQRDRELIARLQRDVSELKKRLLHPGA
jgi:hypothetical protein